MLQGKSILLIVTGGIAAYKSLDLIRRLKERGATVTCVLTRAGAEFVTPLSLSALSENRVYQDLFSLTDESEMGHIELSRAADLILVAPATANILAKMAAGIGDDLATTLLLATDAPVMVAPAMNVRMWEHPATRANLATLEARGVLRIGPAEGPMACGEYGMGRLAEVDQIVSAVEAFFGAARRLEGARAIVTSGPTVEPIDPVRYIANRSSGKQGHAIAQALADLGAEVILVSGPTHEPDPPGVKVVPIETAAEMLAACRASLPADVAVCAAAVSDWRIARPSARKIKKGGKAEPPTLTLAENPDILAALSVPGADRPRLVVGFAAETEDLVANAQAKRNAKGCDWIVANDVSAATGTFGGEANRVVLIAGDGEPEEWPRIPKREVAVRLAARIADAVGAAE